jgi:diguanylate cyclase (GGDEF)-like protein/PAS domain S-box-containing protein
MAMSTQELDRVREELELLRALIDAVPAMLAYWDNDQRCRVANRAYETWFGVSPEALVGRTMRELLGPIIYELNLPHILAALRGEPQHFDREIPDPAGGPPRQSQADYIPRIVDGAVRGFFVLVSDVSQRKRLEDELLLAKEKAETLARHDYLTGLPNRIVLEDRGQRAIELARRNRGRVGILYLDLDGFKAVNDTAGHEAGDVLLRELAVRLEAAVRKSDTVARLGGDEFIVLLPELQEREHAVVVAEKVLDLVRSAPFTAGGRALSLSFSAGVATYPDDGADLREVLARADAALVAAKRAGKNRCVLVEAI